MENPTAASPDQITSAFGAEESRRLEYDNARPERPIIGAELCDLPITDDDIRALVRDGAEIEYLNLNGTEISDETIPQLKQLNRLTHLNLAHTQITDAGLQQLADSGNLEYLSLTGTRINDDSLRYLRGLTNLKRLDLMHTSITDAGLKSLEELRKLRLIGFSGTRITDRGIRQLASKLPGLAETLREDDE